MKSHYHSFIKQLVHSMQVLFFIWKFTYLIIDILLLQLK